VPVEGAHLVGVGCKVQDVGFRYLERRFWVEALGFSS
jgi:hypothetical protein